MSLRIRAALLENPPVHRKRFSNLSDVGKILQLYWLLLLLLFVFQHT